MVRSLAGEESGWPVSLRGAMNWKGKGDTTPLLHCLFKEGGVD